MVTSLDGISGLLIQTSFSGILRLERRDKGTDPHGGVLIAVKKG